MDTSLIRTTNGEDSCLSCWW